MHAAAGGVGSRLGQAARLPEAGRVVEAAARGTLRVQVDTLPLTAAAAAHRRIESGSTTGKLVLAVNR